MLEVRDLSAGYGKVPVIHDISFEVPTGELVAIMGNNGAGKTTLLKSLSGIIPANRGSVVFDGVDITTTVTNRRAKAGIAYVPQGQQSFSDLTTEENLLVVADTYGKAGHQRMDMALDLFPALKEFLGRKAGLLSGGQRQQLAIARALLTNPKLIMFDEPTEGIQPNVVADIQEAIRSMVEELRLSVLLVEQRVGFAVEIADSYVVLASGRITATGEGGSQAIPIVRNAMSI